MKNQTLLLAMVGVLAVSMPLVVDSRPAHAEPRQNTLASDVAVRHRRLLVKRRFEVTPLFESTVNADYRHIIGGGLKVEYHLSDMWSIGAVGVGSTAVNTALVNKILPSLEKTADPATREPSQTEFKDHLNSMPLHGAAFLSFTPWYGKLAAFGQAFVAFDFYFQAGVSFAMLKSDCPKTAGHCDDTHPGQSVMQGMDSVPADNDPKNDPPLNDGNRVGLYLGGGIHVFLSDFLALDLTVRDYAFSDNPSGADYNADQFVGTSSTLGDDNRFLHHLFFGAGLSIMLPTTVKRTP
jgi:outer membrane beta-barrel protein